MQSGSMQTLRPMRVPRDILFSIGAALFAWFVPGLLTGHSYQRKDSSDRGLACAKQPAKPRQSWRVVEGAPCNGIKKENQMKRYYGEDEPLTVLPELDQPLLESDLSAEIEKLRLADSWQRKTGRSSKTLLNSAACGILLIAMKQGSETKEHRVDGRITIHTLVGRIRLKMSDRTVEVPAGHLLMLDRGIVHDLQAVEESAFLLTMCWHGGARSA